MYCVAADLYLYGLPRGALRSPGRSCGTVDISADTIELDAHGFATNDAVRVRAVGGGTLPSPLTESTDYYAIYVDDWHFALATSVDGARVDITSAGTTFVVLAPLPISALISKASRLIDDMLPAHVVPLSAPYPDVVVMTCAELAASEALAMTGALQTTLTAVYDAARARLARWAKYAPVRGTSAPATSQESLVVTRATEGWRRYGGIE